MADLPSLEFLEPVEQVFPINEAGEFLGSITQYADGHLHVDLNLPQDNPGVGVVINLLRNFQTMGKMYKDS